jgi:cell volume regulation protein A
MNILITVCVLLLVAYLFDLTSSFTKIPSVILLLVCGWLVRQACTAFNITVPDLNPLLPVLGTVGLILIVLEGSLELDVDKTKFPMIKKSIVVAFLPMIILAALLGFFFQYVGGYTLKDSITYAMPFCVISSAIAIPSVKSIHSRVREFVVFETSLSDIIGVLLFNFVALNAVITTDSLIDFFIEIGVITVLSFIATIGLSLLLTKVEHHIKYSPIIIIIILFYGVSKIYHLPGLVFIMIFGLLLGNIKKISTLKFFRKIKYKAIATEVVKLHELSVEAAFLIRSLFFLLFGFLMSTKDIINTDTILYALGIVAAILVIRLLQLLLYKIPLLPIVFIAPRGLITILLYVAIVPEPVGTVVSKALVIQVVVITTLVMMIGLMFTPKELQAKSEGAHK